MYHFANQNQVKDLNQWCLDILHEMQDEVQEYFTFDIRLIGSGDKRLVTQNSEESFDLDYNIILQRDKKGLLDNPKQIKDLFVSKFNKVLKENIDGYFHACDSTSVVTVKIIRNNTINFSFDVAIIVEGDDGYFYRLTNDKISNRYIWNRVKNSNNYFERFQRVKQCGKWMQFKKRYLELKNMHLSRQDEVKSFSVFLETLNEFC